MTVDELHLIRDLRSDVPEPDAETSARAYRNIVERAERRQARGARFPVALAVAVVAITAAVLTVASPWSGGPTLLQRAAAALESPNRSAVLAQSVVVQARPTNGGPPITLHLQVWVAGAAPRRFRVVILSSTNEPRSVEVGGTVGATTGLSYQPTGNFLLPATIGFPVSETELDPTTFIRAALASGHARLAGTGTISGRKVVRIVLGSRLDGHVVSTTVYYADAHTYQPIRIQVSAIHPNAAPRAFPPYALLQFPSGYLPGSRDTSYIYTYDFSKITYLASGAANLALCDIKAQHPGAKII